MGLFDLDMSNPEAQGFNSALMQAAAALLTPRHRGGGVGSAFAAFPQAIDRAKQNAMREQLLALQGRQMGLQTDKLGFDMEQARAQHEAARARQAQFAQLVGGLPPDQQGIAQALGPDYFKGLAPQAPKPMEPSSLGKLVAERDKFPDGHPLRAVYDQAIAKATTHQPATTVNVNSGQKDTMWGEPPKGYVWARDPASGQVMTQPDKSGAVAPMALPIAGSKEARDREEVQAKQKQRQEYAQNVAGTILSTVREARSKVGILSAGFGGSIMGNVPGSAAVDLRALIDPIKANIGFQRLQEMRDMSPTGGALGQVAVQELNMLQSVVSSLDQSQSPDQLRKSFDKIEKHFNNWLKVMTQADGEQPSAPGGNSDPLGIR